MMTSCSTSLPHDTDKFIEGHGLLDDQASKRVLTMFLEEEEEDTLVQPAWLHAVSLLDHGNESTHEQTHVTDKTVREKSPLGNELHTMRMSPTSRSMSTAEGYLSLHDRLTRILVDGYVVVNRYVIRNVDALSSKWTCRFADDRFTGQRVFLKFYSPHSTELRRVTKMHELLKDSRSVCKLIEVLPCTRNLPVCLVFEAGSYTLAQRLESKPFFPDEQQDVLQSILQVLSELHRLKIVHCLLDPSHIMWFPTDSHWKFVNLKAATIVGEYIPLPTMSSLRSMAPEIRAALQQHSNPIRAETSSDMFSFGLIAFEVFTGASVLSADGVKRFIAQERRWLEEKQENDMASNIVAERRFEKPIKRRLLEFNFILAFLTTSPSSRQTALHAFEATPFEVPVEEDDPGKILFEYFSGRVTQTDRVCRLGKWLVCHVAFSQLDYSVSVQRFAPESDASLAFHERPKGQTKQFFDDYLPNYPVHILITGEPFCIRISIGRDPRLRFPFEKIVSVEIIPPENKGHTVDIWQQNQGLTFDALAFVEPSEFESERLNTKCPIFGLVETKYVKLVIHLTLRLGEGFPYDIEVYRPVYLQLKRPPRRFGLFKIHRGEKKE